MNICVILEYIEATSVANSCVFPPGYIIERIIQEYHGNQLFISANKKHVVIVMLVTSLDE